ncbi:MAG TPA: urea ABC transporter ATP-binding subunit UrtE [Tepidisphaeraceae bacterium]|jgi:urea transport system ATP-binding protein
MLNVNQLHVNYGQSEIIHDMSFSARRGETLAIMGRNGMGKTTLMKSLIGILKSRAGTIEVDGAQVADFDSWKRVKKGLAFVPQGRQVFSVMTVEENIKAGLETVRKRSIPSYIYDLFPILKEMRKRKAGNLSGGQQQQLAISRALVSNPKVLLLDEPTEGIQPSIIKDIARALNEIKKMRDLTIIVSEQVLSFTLEIADRILVIESGRVVHEDERSQVDEAKISRYLSV